MGFSYLPHTADVKILAGGNNFLEALEALLQGCTNILVPVDTVERTSSNSITVEGATKERLVYEFLSTIIAGIDIDGFLPISGEFTITQRTHGVQSYVLNATLYGDTIERYETSGAIKAVTLHDLTVQETAEECTITVVLDI